jgi:hypothetical protein
LKQEQQCAESVLAFNSDVRRHKLKNTFDNLLEEIIVHMSLNAKDINRI